MTNPVTAAIWLYKIGSKLLTGTAKNIPKGATKLSQHPTQSAANKALSATAVKTQKGVTKLPPGQAKGAAKPPQSRAEGRAYSTAVQKQKDAAQLTAEEARKLGYSLAKKHGLLTKRTEDVWLHKGKGPRLPKGVVKGYARGGGVRPAMNEYRAGDEVGKKNKPKRTKLAGQPYTKGPIPVWRDTKGGGGRTGKPT